jgi:serine protease Do
MPPVMRAAPTAPVMAMTDIDMWADAEGVAGARLVAVTDGLGKALGVKSGVLVLRSSPGTPAYESGLREGDVILRAEGKSVASIRDVRRVAASADRESGVSLIVLRERRERPLTLRW